MSYLSHTLLGQTVLLQAEGEHILAFNCMGAVLARVSLTTATMIQDELGLDQPTQEEHDFRFAPKEDGEGRGMKADVGMFLSGKGVFVDGHSFGACHAEQTNGGISDRPFEHRLQGRKRSSGAFP